MSGWIAISRDLFAHEFFAREPMSEREAWVWMIAKAAWKETRHRIGGGVVDVPRGAFFCTLRELQHAWGWGSDKRVRTFLKRLENERMIDASTDTGKTQISICNYEQYQEAGRSPDASQDENGRSRDALKEQVNNKQETKEDKTYYEVSSAPLAIDDISEAVAAFNEMAASHGISQVQKMTDTRRKALRGRLKDCGGIDGWRVALSKIEQSDFLTGRSRQWRCDFDWINKPANFTKLMEGNYDNRDNHPSRPAADDPALRAIAIAARGF